ncbi:MAG: DUF4349 domain-containing protein [Acidimicrobiia bacterium]
MGNWKRQNLRRGGGAVLAVVLLGGAAVALFDRQDAGSTSRRSSGTAAGERSTAPGSTRTDSASTTTGAPLGPATAGRTKAAPAGGWNATDASSSEAIGVPPLTTLPAPAPLGTKIVKNGSLTVRVKRHGLEDALGRVLSIVGTTGGAVQSSESAGGTAALVLRIPADKFETAVVELRKLGKVTGSSLKSDEVTARYVDLQARLRNLQAQAAVMLDLMRQAKTIPDTITVQQQLSQVQGQIEELQGQLRVLDDQTAFATLAVSLTERGAPVPVRHEPQPESQLSRSWHRATDAALAIVGGTIVVLGALLPLAVIALVVTAVVVPIRRRRQAPTPPAPTTA